ncbi:hypothetical protein [Tropicimonas sediminicola]|uniref:VPLPA-CTERM protein sorting domain-containing protein n=1 Tax=Tropicimonas sediminicola TaxID=1031541 RepID=A0A239JZ71_9RHOB|nr:hypothetical protein [Tropicimonas sediminicola]SNT10778.1 hypothetical protein SAMN05421757_106137 [Tropicimonas sediminicola]
MNSGQLSTAVFSLALLALASGGAAEAAVVNPGGFTPDAVEDFEGTAGGRAVLSTIFGGDVAVTPSPDSLWSVDAGNWSDFRGGSPIVPNSGTRFGTIAGFGGFELDFTGIGGILGFGGWASAAGSGNDVLEFFDLSGNSIGTFTETGGFGPGNGTMVQFSFLSSVTIGSILLSGPETAFDDLSYLVASQVPLPGSLSLLGGALLGAGWMARRRRAA